MPFKGNDFQHHRGETDADLTSGKNGVKLGVNQDGVLRALGSRNGGVWFPGCGWAWNTVSQTRRILDSLVLRGLVVLEKLYGREQYRITEEGLAVIAPTLPRPPQEDLRTTLVMLAEQGGEWKPGCGWWNKNEEWTKLCLAALVTDGYVARMDRKDHYGIKGTAFDVARAWGWDDTVYDDEI